MIRALRARHRTLVLAAALVAPTLLVLALADRKPAALDNTPLVATPAPAARAASVRASGSVAVGDTRLQVNLHGANDEAYLSFAPIGRRGRTGPDVLLYAQDSASGEQLARDALLLGPLPAQANTRIELPAAVRVVVFYSLAHQQVLATLPMDALE